MPSGAFAVARLLSRSPLADQRVAAGRFDVVWGGLASLWVLGRQWGSFLGAIASVTMRKS